MAKELTQEQIDLLNKPLPKEAIKQHPTKTFLNTIKAIYVTERLNDVFGVGKWTYTSEIIDATGKMVLIKVFFKIPEYGIEYESYGGNDNSDKGDALKGAVTDAITKIGSYMGIGANVWKDIKEEVHQPVTTKKADKPQAKKVLTYEFFNSEENAFRFFEWMKKQAESKGISAGEIVNNYYEVSESDYACIMDYYELWIKKCN